MMKLKWTVLFSFGLFASNAIAEQSVVIDAQAIGEQSGAGSANPPPASLADANRERALKGGRMSPKQRYEMAMAAQSDSNRQAGNNFLAANKARPGVVSLPSGVQYKVLHAGKGKQKPADASVISCRYQGTLIDGTSFDKFDAAKPEMLRVAGLLPGLKEAVKLMTTGSKWQIVIPPQLAYGDRGNRIVGPNSVLVYDLELVGIK